MIDVAMPDAIVDWMRARDWGMHHLRWHVVRVWDRLDAETLLWATNKGWSRYPVQEGEEGNGLHFLAMHRVMIAQLVAAHPTHSDLFAGWTKPPTEADDPDDPVPGPDASDLQPAMVSAILRLHDQLTTIDGEDELGRFIETRSRPFPAEPLRRSADPSAGIHNHMHNRFGDRQSSIDLGNPLVNIENRRFWKLHGWIDGRWTAYRAITGRSDTDPAYVALLAAEAGHMSGGHVPHHPTVAFPRGVADGVPPAILQRIVAVLGGR